MIPSERTMPTVNVVYEDMLRSWVVRLPGGVKMPARDEADAEQIVRKYAPGSAVKFWRAAPETDTERRAAWGDR